MSYNPNTGLVYIPSSYSSFPYQAAGRIQARLHGLRSSYGSRRRLIEPTIGPEPPTGARGGLQAWDPVNQKLRWNIEGGGGIGGGTTTTAGNLVFQVINDGRFRAISADKGEILYEVQIGRTGMAPPITYEVDGKQYVAFGGGLGRAANVVGPEQREGGQRADDVRVRAGRQGGVAAASAARSRARGLPGAVPPVPPVPAGPAPEQRD